MIYKRRFLLIIYLVAIVGTFVKSNETGAEPNPCTPGGNGKGKGSKGKGSKDKSKSKGKGKGKSDKSKHCKFKQYEKSQRKLRDVYRPQETTIVAANSKSIAANSEKMRAIENEQYNIQETKIKHTIYWNYNGIVIDSNKRPADYGICEYDFKECEAPSAYPSISPSVTLSPSTAPSVSQPPSISQTPSRSPTLFPTLYPSVSPSESFKPTISPSSPSSQPSFLPTSQLTIQPTRSCKGSQYLTDRSVKGEFDFELETNEEITLILSNVKANLMDELETTLLGCGSRRLAITADTIGVIRGTFDQSRLLKIASVKIGDESSEKFADSCLNSSPDCYTTSFILYLDDSIDSLTDNEAAIKALKAIKKAIEKMNNDNIEGIDRILFKGGRLQDTSGYLYSGDASRSFAQVQANKGLSSAGVAWICVVGVMTILFVFAVVRKKNYYEIKTNEGILDNDSTFGKTYSKESLKTPMVLSDTETDLISIASSNWKQRAANVVGEDDSVFSDNSIEQQRRLYGLGRSRRPIVQNDGDKIMNVHKCTSATCPICSNKKGPMFVCSDATEFIEEERLDEMKRRSYLMPDTVDI